jgi:hypothetical protein
VVERLENRAQPQHPQRIGPLADPSVRTVALLRLRVGLGDLLCTVPGFLARMRARRFDLALQVYGENPAANEVTAIGARITSGFQPPRGPRHDPATHLPYPHQVHEIHRYLQLIARLGVPTVGRTDTLEWPLTDADRRGAARLRAAYDLRPGHYGCYASRRNVGKPALAHASRTKTP